MNRHPLRRILPPVTLAAVLLAALSFAAAVRVAPPAVSTAPAPAAPAASAAGTAGSATATAPPGASGSATAAGPASLSGTATAAGPATPPAPAPASPAQPQTPAPAVAPAATTASVPATGAGTRSLDEQIQDLKRQTIELNRDLFVLEEDLLFPANTQVAVFVSVDVGDFFALDSIDLKIDNKEVSNYLYTPREVAALLRGGVQRLYVGNLKAGSHELVAFLNGKGSNNRYYRRAASLRFEKGLGAKYLELKVTDHQHAQEPEFETKDW